MKAMRYHTYGDSDVLVHEEAKRLTAGPGQVLPAWPEPRSTCWMLHCARAFCVRPFR